MWGCQPGTIPRAPHTSQRGVPLLPSGHLTQGGVTGSPAGTLHGGWHDRPSRPAPQPHSGAAGTSFSARVCFQGAGVGGACGLRFCQQPPVPRGSWRARGHQFWAWVAFVVLTFLGRMKNSRARKGLRFQGYQSPTPHTCTHTSTHLPSCMWSAHTQSHVRSCTPLHAHLLPHMHVHVQ